MTSKEERIVKAFRKNLQKLRVERGFSTRKFVYEADISASSLGRLGDGLSNPSLTTLLKLAEALQIDLATLASISKIANKTPLQIRL